MLRLDAQPLLHHRRVRRKLLPFHAGIIADLKLAGPSLPLLAQRRYRAHQCSDANRRPYNQSLIYVIAAAP
jgi:hypothetical protein